VQTDLEPFEPKEKEDVTIALFTFINQSVLGGPFVVKKETTHGIAMH